MNEEARLELERILKKNPEDLHKVEHAFIRARAWALNNEQRRIFAKVLEGISIDEQPKESEVIAPAEHTQTQYTDASTPVAPQAPVQTAPIASTTDTANLQPTEQTPAPTDENPYGDNNADPDAK